MFGIKMSTFAGPDKLYPALPFSPELSATKSCLFTQLSYTRHGHVTEPEKQICALKTYLCRFTGESIRNSPHLFCQMEICVIANVGK